MKAEIYITMLLVFALLAFLVKANQDITYTGKLNDNSFVISKDQVSVFTKNMAWTSDVDFIVLDKKKKLYYTSDGMYEVTLNGNKIQEVRFYTNTHETITYNESN